MIVGKKMRQGKWLKKNYGKKFFAERSFTVKFVNNRKWL